MVKDLRSHICVFFSAPSLRPASGISAIAVDILCVAVLGGGVSSGVTTPAGSSVASAP